MSSSARQQAQAASASTSGNLPSSRRQLPIAHSPGRHHSSCQTHRCTPRRGQPAPWRQPPAGARLPRGWGAARGERRR
jgi:hypothetical protein